MCLSQAPLPCAGDYGAVLNLHQCGEDAVSYMKHTPWIREGRVITKKTAKKQDTVRVEYGITVEKRGKARRWRWRGINSDMRCGKCCTRCGEDLISNLPPVGT